ncbi:DENN domain-containing protein 1A isoform X1 [Megalops cyprinoides]|uniref:DENN domain-containing protein 1A isoform X1 n=1 Tax=Megalops cyprinoides TaxID=118141 RepID=UPI001863CDBC|nr:DENN domain-containing protein 1A isoform X1 [Megalops cyprinoides]
MGSRIKESPESTFEVYVEVTHPGVTGSDPEVRRQFPEDYIDQETLQTLTKFCFPFNVDSLSVSQVGQNFTFVLTDIESKQRFGFCRLSSGARSCFCILSYLPWFEVFYKLLNILADYTTKGQDSQWKELLERLHTLPVPEPGVPVHLSVHSYFTVPDLRELPSIPENRNLTEYFVAVDVNNMLHLYASMLYERRIIICCSKLSTLTACIHGSAAMLYPMYWQHVYIPVLPQHLIDYCCAPMPYLIGVHSSLMEKVKGMALEDVVMLNVDTNTLETPFDDLQSLPNDVVSSLKNRLKKVSTTTGDGVARAFLKAQAALFGSYRNALKIEPEEPITFSEEAFVAHRSSAMRQFLQSAIQLQLFKQFIDGRLELLNSGEGFSDVFEEEINMGEYAGSDKTYHQWLTTVKKGSGAIFNTVKTKANPAMKTVYKFAKDHARMGIKEVKNRLKQKDMTENGYAAAGEDTQPPTAGSPSTDRKEVRLREERRPITVHFGQARPPRPLVVKRPRSNIPLDNRRTSASSPEHFVRPTRHYTVFLSEDSSGDEFQHEEDSVSGFSEHFLFSAPFEWPQPYRTLKEADFAEGEEGQVGQVGERLQGHTAPPSPVGDKITEISLLDDIFNLEGESESQTLTLAKSLEDLRTPKDPEEESAKFSYQRMDLSAERTRTLPSLKHSNPYNKLWSLGQDDMALPCISTQSWDRPMSVPPPEPPEPLSSGAEHLGASQDRVDAAGTGQSSITIPRPQGRKTPELGKVLGPPVQLPRAPKHAPTADPGSQPDSGVTSGAQEFRQALNMSPLSSQHSSPDVLKPAKVGSESLDLLSLLDPLNSAASSESNAQSHALPAGGVPSSGPTLLTSIREDAGTPTHPFPPQHVYPQALPPFPHMSLNPFAQTLHYAPAGPPHRHYAAPGGNPFSTAYLPPGGYFQTSPYAPAPLPAVYRQPSPLGPGFLQQSPIQIRPPFPPSAAAPSSSSSGTPPSLLDCPPVPCTQETPPALPKPPHGGEAARDRAPPEPQDPFGDLLPVTKPAAAPKRRVEDLRRQWETFD